MFKQHNKWLVHC